MSTTQLESTCKLKRKTCDSDTQTCAQPSDKKLKETIVSPNLNTTAYEQLKQYAYDELHKHDKQIIDLVYEYARKSIISYRYVFYMSYNDQYCPIASLRCIINKCNKVALINNMQNIIEQEGFRVVKNNDVLTVYCSFIQ